MRPRLLEMYERELGYLRQLGAEFAQRYPGVASQLLLESDRCADPHVERLLESFSFLAARIHLRLEDDLPELTEGFLDIVYPHYLRPIPSMTIAEFRLEDQYTGTAGALTIPAGTELRTRRTINGMPCRFRTGYPVELWPVDVVECAWLRPEQLASPPRVPDAVAVLRVLLQGRGEAPLASLGIERLVMYLAGEKALTLPLYELLSRNLTEVLLRNPAAAGEPVLSLGAGALQPMGFDESEALLPYTARSFHGHRLLQEYFAFPEKFLFFRLSGLNAAQRVMAGKEVELLLYVSSFDQPQRWVALEAGVSAQTFRLGCSPVINLFGQTAEPITITQTRHEYPVIPDVRHEAQTTVYSIETVRATNPSRRSSRVLQPLFHNQFGGVGGDGVFWRTRREQSLVDERMPPQTHLSIVDRNGVLTHPDAEVLTVRAICTNADAPSKMAYGGEGSDFDVDGFPKLAAVRALHRPTVAYEPPGGPGQVWGLISQLSLNHLSLGEQGLPAFQEILRLHEYSGSPHLSKQIEGIASMETKPHLAVMEGEFGSIAARGTHVELQLREENFAGGGAFLFSQVLHHFFGLYVSMNSFSQLTVRTDSRKGALGVWPPRAGRQLVL